MTAKKTGKVRYPGIPSILDTILQDATLYFVFMFACQVNLEMFLIFAPVGDIWYVRGWLIQLLIICVCSGKNSTAARDVSSLSP